VQSGGKGHRQWGKKLKNYNKYPKIPKNVHKNNNIYLKRTKKIPEDQKRTQRSQEAPS
jgi:hypothetical protein